MNNKSGSNLNSTLVTAAVLSRLVNISLILIWQASLSHHPTESRSFSLADFAAIFRMPL
ncbi:hypothetical protein MiSe_88310 [Microseira wollei NIES-4236]|uniref:Uncharacterized protein n=1 Tax=Microseira wollei NIES-4236 TaxID=2530354 RepID=A0AAV3XTH8_9CYAN|nr:hypothetical protein MiSe_88310 [Microseira wollei NIES-4236]